LVSVKLSQWFDNGSKTGMGLVAIRQGIGVAIIHEFGLAGFWWIAGSAGFDPNVLDAWPWRRAGSIVAGLW